MRLSRTATREKKEVDKRREEGRKNLQILVFHTVGGSAALYFFKDGSENQVVQLGRRVLREVAVGAERQQGSGS